MTVLEHEKIFDLPLKRHSVSPRTDSGLGLLEPLLSDDSVTDIMINRFDRIFIERNGQLLKSSIHLDSPESLLFLAESLIRAAGKEHMVENTPIIDGMLPDGSRVTIILFPVVPAGPSISIRKFPANPLTLDMMVSHSNLTPPMARFLKAATRLRLNILIAGNTSSGKTTLLNAICGHMDAHERIVTIEDTQELRIQQENVVRMVTCAANSHPGGRDITPADLIKSALRIRPDRIIMGEIRGTEAFDFLQAINTGHDGSLATIHANSPREAFARLELLVSKANPNYPVKTIRQQISSSLDLVVQTQRTPQGRRHITHVSEIIGLEGDTLTSQDIFTFGHNSTPEKTHGSWHPVGSRNPKIQQAMQAANTVA